MGSLFCYAVFCVLSCNYLAEEERAGYINLIISCWLVTVSILCLFLTVPLVGLQFVIVLCPGQPHVILEYFEALCKAMFNVFSCSSSNILKHLYR